MFTYIEAKNFKSFKNIAIDLKEKKSTPKSLAIIYGINGSGKTTAAQLIYSLWYTIQTMQVRRIFNDIIDGSLDLPDDIPFKPDVVLKQLKSRMQMDSISKFANKFKRIGSNDNLSLKYDFNIKGNDGSYYIELDSNSIVKERLEYKLNKNKVCFFDIENDSININTNIFKTNDFYSSIKDKVKMYWGKHSLLSILFYEIQDKTQSYIESNFSHSLFDIIYAIDNICFRIPKSSNGSKFSINPNNIIFNNLDKGSIDIKSKDKLDEIENLLNVFFKNIFDDVINAYYEKKIDENLIYYSLFLNKKNGDYKYKIDFQRESNGTKEILNILPYLISAVSGSVVVIDEYSNGIHDLLASKLIDDIASEIKGQLILITHNTLLMETIDKSSNIPADSLYFILDNDSKDKSIKCITEIEKRLHPNYNYRNRYLTNELYKDYLPSLSKQISLSSFADIFR